MPRRRTPPNSKSTPPADEARGATPGAAQTVHFDRVEEDAAGQSRAVLILDDGRSLVVPRDLVPPEATPGAALTWTLSVDADATAATARATAAVRAALKPTDPGGTIHL